LRVLVVNADDFGFTRDVNEGIVTAHREGILTATTLMANGAAFDHAVELARTTPALDVGCHLVLVGGEGQPATVSALIRALALKQVDVYHELRRQVERIAGAGIIPTHLDTHKHTHLLPPVLDAVARLSEEFRIPWVRRPFDLPLNGHQVPWGKQALSRGLGFMRRRFHRVLMRHGCRVTDHFAGFQITGRFEALDVIRLIESLPDGVTEFMVHPGYCTDELRSARTRLKESREHELRALVAPSTRAALARCAVRLAAYRELG
jgi:predicted glycoside hydrolase/deacetylase ChbG (UPF0249 family)